MDMLKKLLNTINLKWAKKAQIKQALIIQRGVGNFPYLTLKDGVMTFHAYPRLEGFTTGETETVQHSYKTDYASPSEVEVPFRADFVERIVNTGNDDLYVNFNMSTFSAGTITIKSGEYVENLPRKVNSLFIRSKTGYQPYEALGVYTNLPFYQEIVLEGMTIRELVDKLVIDLGYMVDTTEAERLNLMDESALLFLDAVGAYIEEDTPLFAFVSNWYRVLYPIHRVLMQFDGDVDVAIQELMLPSARGDWLDYWASFFRIKRLPDESDELMLRRVFMTFTSAKSNNMAMEELVSYYIGTEARVLDAQPAQIEVRVDPVYMDTATKVREIIGLLKGAGVDYFINYQKSFEDNYSVYFRDINGKTIGEMNESFSKVVVTLPVYAEDYQYIDPASRNSFRLGSSRLNSTTARLSKPDRKVIDSVSMVMKNSSGAVIQQM